MGASADNSDLEWSWFVINLLKFESVVKELRHEDSSWKQRMAEAEGVSFVPFLIPIPPFLAGIKACSVAIGRHSCRHLKFLLGHL